MQSVVLFGSCVMRGLSTWLSTCQAATRDRWNQVVQAALSACDPENESLNLAGRLAFPHPLENARADDRLCSIFSLAHDEAMLVQPSFGEVQYPGDASGGCTPEDALLCWLDGVEKLQRNDLDALMNLSRRCLRYVPVRFAQQEHCDISVWRYAVALGSVAACLVSRAPAGTPGSKEKLFTLYSLDLSGIQSFLYTITSKGALKGLRARSFYLSLLMEHITDAVLDACGLTRMNVIYCGGGKAHLLLPFEEALTNTAHGVVQACNAFFLAQFDTALYLSDGWSHAGANALGGGSRDNPLGELFREASVMISERKTRRYSANAYLALNQAHSDAGEHECAICGSVHGLRKREEDWLCDLCYRLEQFSPALTSERQTFAVVQTSSAQTLPLPCDCFLQAVSAGEADCLLAQEKAKRLYAVHQDAPQAGRIELKLGNYQPCASVTFEMLADASQGIRRLAVLRADVDNLGELFSKGLTDPGRPKPYTRVSLARYGALSEAITDFFQDEINRVVALRVPSCPLAGTDGGEARSRNVSVVYAGGDDLFLVGAWNEVIDAGIAVQEAFAGYTGGRVTLSCGITLETEHMPIRVMANHAAALEDAAKHMDGKAAVGLFEPPTHASDGFIFKWSRMKGTILSEMLPALSAGCAEDEEAVANALLYHVWALLRDTQAGPMRLPRLAYLLTRHSMGDKAVAEDFGQHLYRWAMEPETSRELQAAILLYVYLHRVNE